MRVLKYLASGALGLSVNLFTLHALVIAGVHYLSASIIAFAVATVVGFLCQKFWTFNSYRKDSMHMEFSMYVAVIGCNLLINSQIVFGLVEYLHVHYLVAQFVGAAVLAAVSYFIYALYIFKVTL